MQRDARSALRGTDDVQPVICAVEIAQAVMDVHQRQTVPRRDVQHVLHTLVGQLPVNFRQPLRGNPHAIVRYAQRAASRLRRVAGNRQRPFLQARFQPVINRVFHHGLDDETRNREIFERRIYVENVVEAVREADTDDVQIVVDNGHFLAQRDDVRALDAVAHDGG